ncbi:MAG: metallophosphoesterase [Bacteroidota bacterium]
MNRYKLQKISRYQIFRRKYCLVPLVFLLCHSCATYETKYLEDKGSASSGMAKEISNTFYLIGDAGLSPEGGMSPALRTFKDRLDNAPENSTAIFLGDNIYPAGMPDPEEDKEAYLIAKNNLDAQIESLTSFKGKPLFIPGNHDWYTEGLKGLKRQQKYIQKALDYKDAFLPKDGCPIEVVEVNKDVVVIVLDTEWFVVNWDKHPGINDKCEIKSTEKFFLDLLDEIKKYRDRTTLIALHHPMFSYGIHGGQYSFKKQFYPKDMAVPLPVLGTVINLLRKTTGVSTADMQNKRYRELINRVTTLAQYSDKVIFASGHEHTLQYIVERSTPQIVSGSGSKTGATRLLNGSTFSTGRMGYAILEVYKDGSSHVSFYGVGEEEGAEEFLYGSEVLPPDQKAFTGSLPDTLPEAMEASIYTEEEIDKSGFFKTLWGERYRKYYATKVKAQTVDLDTLFGGLKPIRRGGGNQSKSLRLRHKSGKEYVMRALRKKADLYLQAMAFKEQYLSDELQDSYLTTFLEDFYTGAHPYAPFTIADLSDAIGIYHTNPVLYYVPKQKALQDFNADYGDELYMIEEHAGDGHGNLRGFGFSDEVKSTDAMLDDLRDDEKYAVDSEMYIRARLFDMAIGDWDRHVDQWRWVEFKDKETGKVLYRPLPRDRDQAYSILGDGLFMKLATRFIPGLRLFEGFEEEIRSVKGFNSSPKTYVLDIAVLSETRIEQWREQARLIKQNLTPEVIDRAFENFPEEVRDLTVKKIRRILLSRVENIEDTAEKYFKVLNKYATVIGTDKDDWFQIERLSPNETRIRVYRIIGGKKERLFFDKTFHANFTKEVWVYGLDDDDHFEVIGEAGPKIRVRLIGGQNHDVFQVENGSKVAIYDQKSKKNTVKKANGGKVKRIDDYDVNTYRPLKIRSSTNQGTPLIGFNPDDGLKIGYVNTYTFNGFRQNPFTQQHTLNGAFYFATSGFELGYSGEFAEIIENWNLELATRFTSPNFAINFFGFGNDTPNFDDDLDLDFNRVKLETFEFAPSLVWRSQMDAKVRLGVSYEILDVEETPDRFIEEFVATNDFIAENSFFGVHGEYSYSNFDYEAFPTLGMATSLLVGYKTNISETGSFGYVIPSLSFNYKLIPSGRMVLATKWKAHFNLGEGYEFYQAANIGDNNGLRGFRRERFTGKTAYFQNTDIRYSFSKMRTGILPTALGIYGGFDYGRVWEPGEDSDTWHTSYGLGFFANAADLFSLRTAIFNSTDGPRFTFGLGFGF